MTPLEISLLNKGWMPGKDGSWSRPKAVPVLDQQPAKKVRKPRRMPKPLLMNKLEQRFARYMVELYPGTMLHAQAVTLRLAAGTTYTPDFLMETAFYEVKGPHMWDDAWVKLKLAAKIYPQFTFYFCEEIEGKWSIQRVPVDCE